MRSRLLRVRPQLHNLERRDVPANTISTASDLSVYIRDTVTQAPLVYVSSGQINPAADVDMYKLAASAGQTIRFDMDTPRNGPPGLNSYLRLFNSSGAELAANDNAVSPDDAQVPREPPFPTNPPLPHNPLDRVLGFDAFIEYTIPTDGTYYVGVSSWQNRAYDALNGTGNFSTDRWGIGDYQLMVSYLAIPTGTGDPPTSVVAIGTESGLHPTVEVINAVSGKYFRQLQAYATDFPGGVRVATGDVDLVKSLNGVVDNVNGVTHEEIITAPGPGGGPDIRIFSGVSANYPLLREFYAYDPSFTGGVYVAVADVDGDGHADIITGAGAGGGPHVKIFSGTDGHLIGQFFAYAPSFHGGVNVAAADLDGDGHAEIITGAGAGGGAHVKIYSGATLTLEKQFFAFDPALGTGATVAAGDFDGDGVVDVAVAPARGGGPHVRIYRGTDFGLSREFFALPPDFAGGVRLGSSHRTDNNTDALLIGGGQQMPINVYSVRGADLTERTDFTLPDIDVGRGVYVG